jgi:hypothetical protein
LARDLQPADEVLPLFGLLLGTSTVAAGPGGVRVEVTDSCGDGSPVLLPAGRADAEGGRGLRLVEALATRWGYERGGGLATTWFELVPG